MALCRNDTWKLENVWLSVRKKMACTETINDNSYNHQMWLNLKLWVNLNTSQCNQNFIFMISKKKMCFLCSKVCSFIGYIQVYQNVKCIGKSPLSPPPGKLTLKFKMQLKIKNTACYMEPYQIQSHASFLGILREILGHNFHCFY